MAGISIPTEGSKAAEASGEASLIQLKISCNLVSAEAVAVCHLGLRFMESGSSRTTLEGSGNLNLFCRETVLGRLGHLLRAAHLQGCWPRAEILRSISNVIALD